MLSTPVYPCAFSLFFLALAQPYALAESEPPAHRPNIVFILADDLGYTDLSCQGSDLYQTPSIDAFARQSLSFTNAYTSHPTCSPSRSAIMTGKYPARLGIVSHGGLHSVTAGDGTFMVSEEYTLAEALRDSGYTTCHIGKWHVGHDGKSGPKEQGFQHDIASNEFCCPGSFFYPYRDKKKPGKQGDSSAVPDLQDRGPGDHLTECLGDEAAKFIAKQADASKQGQPFFLNLWYYAVHTPIEAEKEQVAKYKVLRKSGAHHRNANYAALVEHLDESVGQVLNAIEENGLADNTIVIFFSDNGGEIRGGVTSNYPLRDGKVSQYEGGVRVPMFVRWPGTTQAGAECHERVIGHDFYPTILKMTGATGDAEQNAAMDGVDLTPLMQNPTTELKPRAFHWMRYPVVFHYKNQYKQRSAGPVSSMLLGKWKLFEFFKTPQGQPQEFELYDLESDPSESTNLADQMPDKVSELHAKMMQWRRDVAAPPYEMAYREYEKIE